MTTIINDTVLSLDDVEIVETRTARISKKWVHATQYLAGILLIPFFHIFFKVKIHGRENLSTAEKPLIIAANHVSFYDSFLFRLTTSYENLPLRFMAVTNFSWKSLNFLASLGIIRFVYSLFGVFTIVPGRGMEANLKESKQILQNGSTVVIYPEGHINTDRNIVASFKKGVAVLAQGTGVPLIPVAFRIHKAGLFRRNVSMKIGELFLLPAELPIKEATELVQKKVTELFRELA